MAWENSDRKDRLPANWQQLVKAVLRRCYDPHVGFARCEWKLKSGKRCPRRATDVDHIVPGDNHSLRNLRGLCPHHHGKKSASEGNAARRKKAASRFRPQETHPGLIGRVR